MEKYKRRAQLLCDLYGDVARTTQYQLDAFRDIYLEIESASTPADLWAYLDVESKKAIQMRDGDSSYEDWEKARYRLKALEYAEEWLKKVGYGE